ncbi:DNA sulfur modification protein DndE [Desulfofustis glycolicus]|uniref:DNA sulfur modification protein DndE n=1 Tax=Desulfofustis glycolicus DSM 9705 TaxID=1121409 RepID=A0A1M5UK15_9BACT|nr:DNA sulfur modification protein DndE [Desulfofustis glycolicus]SHH63412.1 DNA sulfur modification protein DndE [Desulfofustis glycolicus DSM 9705]
MPIEHIKLSQKERENLIRLKRVTGIKNWNTLCRWAFCISLANPEKPRKSKIVSDSSLEMTWKVFGGKHHEIYTALLIQRCKMDGVKLEDDNLMEQFRYHMKRGIDTLTMDRVLKKIDVLLSKALTNKDA